MLMQGRYGRLLEPGLRKIFFDSYREKPQKYKLIFNVQDSDKAVETDFRMGGFGLFERKESAGSIQYDDPTRGQPLQYIHEEYAKGFTIERKFVRDQMYNQIRKMPKKLGVAARATVETVSAKIINTAFDQVGFDGQPLISKTHKALNDVTVINNLLSASYGAGADNGALSDRNLKAALIQAADQKNDAGLLIECNPSILLVPPALRFKAETIIGSGNLSELGTGSGITNDKNALKDKFNIVVWDYISAANGGSDTHWFVIDPTVAELNFFWRDKLEFENDNDFDTKQAKYSAYMRFSVGYSDFRGIVGSKGTGAA